MHVESPYGDSQEINSTANAWRSSRNLILGDVVSCIDFAPCGCAAFEGCAPAIEPTTVSYIPGGVTVSVAAGVGTSGVGVGCGSGVAVWVAPGVGTGEGGGVVGFGLGVDPG